MKLIYYRTEDHIIDVVLDNKIETVQEFKTFIQNYSKIKFTIIYINKGYIFCPEDTSMISIVTSLDKQLLDYKPYNIEFTGDLHNCSRIKHIIRSTSDEDNKTNIYKTNIINIPHVQLLNNNTIKKLYKEIFN